MRVAIGDIREARDDIWEIVGHICMTSSHLRVTPSDMRVAVCSNSRISSELRVAIFDLRDAICHI